MLGVVVQHFVKTLTEYEIKNDKELSWIRVLSRHVTGDIIWAVWPWTRFAWRETSTLPPGMYKWEYSCRLHNHTAHTDGSSSKSCINPILAAMIWLCHPLKLCLCLMFVNSRKKKSSFDHSDFSVLIMYFSLVLRLLPLYLVQISSTDFWSWIKLPGCIFFHYDDGEYFKATPNNRRNYSFI